MGTKTAYTSLEGESSGKKRKADIETLRRAKKGVKSTQKNQPQPSLGRAIRRALCRQVLPPCIAFLNPGRRYNLEPVLIEQPIHKFDSALANTCDPANLLESLWVAKEHAGKVYRPARDRDRAASNGDVVRSSTAVSSLAVGLECTGDV